MAEEEWSIIAATPRPQRKVETETETKRSREFGGPRTRWSEALKRFVPIGKPKTR